MVTRLFPFAVCAPGEEALVRTRAARLVLCEEHAVHVVFGSHGREGRQG